MYATATTIMTATSIMIPIYRAPFAHLYPPPRNGVAVQPPVPSASIRCRMEERVHELLRTRRYDEALEQLLDLYEQKVFRMAVAMLRDAGRAEEITQDVFLKLWRALPGYD